MTQAELIEYCERQGAEHQVVGGRLRVPDLTSLPQGHRQLFDEASGFCLLEGEEDGSAGAEEAQEAEDTDTRTEPVQVIRQGPEEGEAVDEDAPSAEAVDDGSGNA